MTEEEWPDPKKWHYDELSGEFFPITERMKNGTEVFDRKPYDQRWNEWYKCRSITKPFKYAFIGCVVITVVGLFTGGGVLTFIGVFIGVVPGALWAMFGHNTKWLEKRIGPKPRRRPIEAPVHQQPAASPTREAADYSGKMS